MVREDTGVQIPHLPHAFVGCGIMKIQALKIYRFFVIQQVVLITFIVLSLVGIQAFAGPKPNLVEIAKVDNVIIEIETTSITFIGSTRRFKLHANFIRPQQNDYVEDNQVLHKFSEPVSKLVDTIEMNCTFETFHVVKKQFFNSNLKTLYTYEPETPKMEQVIPENVAGLLFPFLCNKQPTVKYEI